MTPLEELLQQCTVKITVPGGWGTGFFVAPGLILTCAHVVRKATDLQVTIFYPAWQQPLSAVVKAKADDGKTLDLALVELSEPLSDHPCVLLDEEPVVICQALYSYGYLESYTNAAPVRPVNEGLTGDTPPLLKLQGAQIEKGISGAALLNLKTGKVCGMVKETRAASFDLGGGAIPTRVILEQFPELRELQREFHEGDRRWVDLITTQSGIDFQPYREAVICHYSQQCHLYIPNDALLHLEARSVERPKKDSEQEQSSEKNVEQFPVLDGLRKYALGNQREHVLLAGRPGSGKSTTLRQLAVSLAAAGQVPILVQLKGDRPVPDLIQAEFRRMKQRVTPEQINEWLLADRLVLLLDGVNEIPNDELRRKLARFRQENLTMPMIFTTRDLSLGGVFGIDKRLEMKPLSPKQVREFVGKYLPEQGDRLLEQLRDRLRELAETPLLLKLLCDVFDPETKQIPQNRGELFQCFDRDYKRIKKEIEYVPVSENFWEYKSEILQYLAFSMIQGEVQTVDLQNPPEPWLTIPKKRAEGILETWLHQRGVLDAPTKAKLWLKDLCNHHLLQDAAKPEEIEFHHQLFQEYYAAEYLLQQLPDLLKDENRFKQNYLNYLKWTEPISLMLALENKEAQVLRVVKLALDDVDWMLGARLAGEVKSAFQPRTVEFVEDLEVPDWLKVQLLGKTRSRHTITRLLKLTDDSSFYIRVKAANALGEIRSEMVVPALLKLLKHADSLVRMSVTHTLCAINSETIVPDLLNLLEDTDSNVRQSATYALCTISPEVILPNLLNLLEDPDPNVHKSAAHALCTIRSDTAIPSLLKLLSDSDPYVRGSAAYALSIINSETIIPDLIQRVDDSDSKVRESIAMALGNVGSETAIPGLLKLLGDSDAGVRGNAAKALGNIGSETAIPALLKLLNDSDPDARGNAAYALGNIGSEIAIPGLLKLLDDSDSDVCWNAANALGNIGSETAIPALLKLLNDSDPDARGNAAYALGKIGAETAIPALLKLLDDSNSEVRGSAAGALGDINFETLGNKGFEASISSLIKLLDDSDSEVRMSAAMALGSIGSAITIPTLIQLLDNSDFDVRMSAADALGEIEKKHRGKVTPYLPHLIGLIPSHFGRESLRAIHAIQENCKYYTKLEIQNKDQRATVQQPTGETHRYTVNTEVFQVIENNHGNVIGKQSP